MGLSVSASRGLWPGCGYGPRQQRLRLTGAVHNALWCTSNCPDIRLNWANALPALQSALLSLSLLSLSLPTPHGPKAWAAYPEISSCWMLSYTVRYHFNPITAHFLFFKPLPTTDVFNKSEHTLLTGDHLFCFNKRVLFLWLLHSLTPPHMQSALKPDFPHSALCKMWF